MPYMGATTEEPTVNAELARELGLLEEEFNRIKKILGRTPNFTELSVYAVMWSEHCSYKNSIYWLKTLPKEGEGLLAEAGEENAGLVDIGEGLACAFKMESHNHPSAIEPYQGAATGVGGIHRDIFTMGARPIAALDSLRFGDLSTSHTKHLLEGVVKGIGDYGNCFGVPTVGGEIYFNECYEHNPLVNAMSVGIVETDKVISATSKGKGNPVYIVGSSTGKDGIHGATFASEDIAEDSEENLPAVQVGDPFQEKLLLEATMELKDTDAVVGMQDMGAAGIACSTSEMSEDGGHGMNVYLDKVPMRQPNMAPFEILLSESQERMLIVVKKGHEKEVEDIFAKWELNCAIIGEVTEGNDLRYYMHDELVAQIPADSLVLGGGAPVYQRDYQEAHYYKKLQQFDQDKVMLPKDWHQVAEKVITSPNVASKRCVYEQYDSMVGINTLTTNKPADAAIVRVKGESKDLALSADCNPRYVYADPYQGTAIAVAEAARNIVCAGGQPKAITDCLNFGNPYKPEGYWQFVMAIKGISAACQQFGTPVTGGNVSFYNQKKDGDAVYPTPAIGMLGLIDDPAQITSLAFSQKGHVIYMIGKNVEDISCSEYLIRWHGLTESPIPYFDLEEESAMQQSLQQLTADNIVASAHDVSEGGLLTALMEAGFPHQRGFDIETDASIRKDAFLFGEAQGRAVVTVDDQQQDKLEAKLESDGVPFLRLGKVTDGEVNIDQESFGQIGEWYSKYEQALEEMLRED